MKTNEGVFVSWRLLGNESYDAGFNLYRNGRKLNRKPLTDTTNYLDPAGTGESIYSVRRVFDGREHPLAALIDAVRRGVVTRTPPKFGKVRIFLFHCNDRRMG